MQSNQTTLRKQKTKYLFTASLAVFTLVLIGITATQTLDSNLLKSDIASGVASESGKTCATQVTSADDCSLCCGGADTMNGASDTQVKICAISCGTAFRTTDEAVLSEKAAAEKAQAEADASAGETIDAARAANPDYYAIQDASTAATLKNIETAKAAANTETSTATPASKTTDSFLGSGFENSGLANFSSTATNPSSTTRGAGFNESGIGTINALLYNVKDFFKYAASGMAVLWLLLAAFQLVTASDEEGIKKGKTNLTWSIIALAIIFAIDILVIAFFEGGSAATPGGSLFTIVNGKVTVAETSFVTSIATYFQTEARNIFGYLKVLAGAVAVLFMFLAGVHIISAGGNEEGIEKEKKYLIHSLTAFITLIVLDNLIFNFIYPANTSSGLTTPECVEFLKSGNLASAPASCRSAIILGQTATTQIMGVVNFFSSLMGGIAVFFIVYSAIFIISSLGNEEVVTKHKKTLLWSIGGLGVILLADTLIRSFIFVVDSSTGTASVNINQGIQLLTGITNFLTTFVGIISVVAILIAGIFWVANFGNDEVAGKAKKIILGAIAGIIISISAYSLVNTLASGSNSNTLNKTTVQVSI